MTAKFNIGFLVFDQLQGLDLVGPNSVFDAVNELQKNTYQFVVISEKGESITTESKLKIEADRSFKWQGQLDTLIIPGGVGARQLCGNDTYKKWIVQRSKTTRRLVTICTGAYLLAATGLLDGRKISTHWQHIDDFNNHFPLTKADPNCLFIKDGPYYTSAGVTAGIDLVLSLVEEDCSKHIAIKVARQLVVYYRRPGDQGQYSEPLQFQINSQGKFEALPDWILNNLTADLSIDSLAGHLHMSNRTFQRKFRQQFSQTPAQYILALRLETARQKLTATTAPIEAVAEAVGFSHVDIFRRGFNKRYGINPNKYRQAFSG